ncbi:origin recognition complex (ORC) subunit 3 [Sphaeroforma arctica JP610]|uniref:Origin recognition complex (ORC) subunit 3 n=1 Tax=Sphaeroforma arctica JP610 TaxID=667725 RepID=A0A0L0G989_9EUKA|nr:origin recognition complex (ORC) subunit 3 [Sphaeroforma arctica JP610]KNC85572.1 origin recognition complex (ORC) subunit 3 [Sphaeroforma arctica JP610]|eukprot:XP_014159474.1 origin recognition complex (ORC) subunit 3 [Sphaeroforma arctica JP610]
MEKNVATEVGARERLSKAIYFHHPTRDSRNTVPEPLPSACGFPYAFDGETDDKREKRSDAYLECWGVIEGLIDYHTNDLYSQLYGDVNKFVRRASVAFNKRTAIVEQSEPRTNTAHVDSINNTTATGTDNTPGVPSAVHTPSKLFSGSSYGRYDTLSVSEIPTALLHTGSNVSDHPVLLNQISHNLMLGSTPGESQVETHSFARGPRPCVLKGDECTTLQTTVKNIVQSFTNVTDDGSSAQIAAIDTTYANAQDFWQLHMWYTARYAPVREANSGDGPTSAGTGAERGSGKPGETDANRTASTDAGTSPPVDGSTQGTTSVASDTAAHTPTPTYTAKHTQLRYPPLVVLFDDFERFSGPLLDALIHICRQWLPSLPFVFIFSIASYFDRVHDVLNRTSLSALNMTRLTLQVRDMGMCIY